MGFAVLADHRVKLKENEKKDKYLDFTRELNLLWNMKVAFTPIVSGTLGTVTKGLIKKLEDLEIRIHALLKLARILRRVLETSYCHSDFNGKPSANAGVENSYCANYYY